MKQRLCALLLAAVCMLSGCGGGWKQAQSQIFAMDTIMTLSLPYQGSEESAQEILSGLGSMVQELEKNLSVTREDSEIHKLNENGGQKTTLSPETAKLLSDTLTLCERTGGKLDITAYSAVKAWGFTTGEYRIPSEEELKALSENIDYTKLNVEGDSITLPKGMQLDLGAVAKGYAGEQLAQSLREQGIEYACLNLGGNVQTVGSKPDGTPWRIGVQDPETGAALGIVEVSDMAVVTSGNYQRYFEENGQRYWHILDPDTASPARSGLSGVTVITRSGLLADGLSTALFVMGLEEGHAHWQEYRDFEAVFLTDDGEVYITAGLKDSFSLAEGFEDREVTVLE